MQVVVARVGKAHGLRGEVTVQVLTGAPDERFVPGATFTTDPAAAGPLVLRSARDNNGILLLGFENTDDRSGAEALRGIKLLADVLAAASEVATSALAPSEVSPLLYPPHVHELRPKTVHEGHAVGGLEVQRPSHPLGRVHLPPSYCH